MATLYENYIAGDDSNALLYDVNWRGQTFTPATSHIITSVKLLLYKVGSPGASMTVSIRATDGGGLPTGADLASGTLATSGLPAQGSHAWNEITLGAGAALTAGTKYAMLFRVSGTASNYVGYRIDVTAATYTGGSWVYSADSGGTWTADTNYDIMFEEWGIISASAPSATTQATTAIDKTTATGNGNVTALGAPAATQYGHVWAQHPNSESGYEGITANGVPAATGAYTSSLTGLTPNTLYYCRAYITNSVGTFVGAEVTFTTLSDVPVVTTDLPTEVATTTALGRGSIDNTGGSDVTEHGVCWSTSANPTTADSKTTDGAGIIGITLSLMTGLTAATLYHVRAYATNSTGTGYGADVTFTTQAVGSPIVTTQAATNVQGANATGNGTLVDIGGSAVTEHGHCWSTSANPTTADSKTTKGAATAGAFTSDISGLTAGTTYHTRAYATNSYGTSYGNDKTFKLQGEGTGILAVVGEYIAYYSKTGKRRAILGVQY